MCRGLWVGAKNRGHFERTHLAKVRGAQNRRRARSIRASSARMPPACSAPPRIPAASARRPCASKNKHCCQSAEFWGGPAMRSWLHFLRARLIRRGGLRCDQRAEIQHLKRLAADGERPHNVFRQARGRRFHFTRGQFALPVHGNGAQLAFRAELAPRDQKEPLREIFPPVSPGTASYTGTMCPRRTITPATSGDVRGNICSRKGGAKLRHDARGQGEAAVPRAKNDERPPLGCLGCAHAWTAPSMSRCDAAAFAARSSLRNSSTVRKPAG